MTVKRDIPVAHHVGFVARDAEKMARAYERLLGARFDLLDPLPVHNLYDEQATIRVAYGAFANLVVEIIEPMDGHLPHHDFLEKYGEGIQHIGFQVDDPAAWTGLLAKAGARIEWIVDDTNHLSIGYLTPDSTNEEMVKRITPDCLSYLDAGIGNVAIEFMGPQIQGRMLKRWDGPLGETKTTTPSDPSRGGVPSEHPLIGELITTTSPNWFTGERRG